MATATAELITITPESLKDRIAKGDVCELIDVRTPAEFQEVHVNIARNCPLDRLDPKSLMENRKGAPNSALYVICRSGSRGKQACQKFLDAGFTNVINVEGGTLACEAAGVPVVRGKKVMSLERQVRIAAGLLVLVGAIPALLGYPMAAGLSAFVGAGLVFAGLTDTCAMGMLIAKMPWNQVGSSCGANGQACAK